MLGNHNEQAAVFETHPETEHETRKYGVVAPLRRPICSTKPEPNRICVMYADATTTFYFIVHGGPDPGDNDVETVDLNTSHPHREVVAEFNQGGTSHTLPKHSRTGSKCHFRA